MPVKLYGENQEMPVKFWTFPGGERGVRIESELRSQHYTVIVDFRGSDDLVDMLMLAEAVRAMVANVKLRLKCMYFPYARQDRRMTTGEAHAMRVVAEIINGCNFWEVEVADPHSDVVEALVKNLKIVEQGSCFLMTVGGLLNSDVLVAPDAGAMKKVYKVAQAAGVDTVVCASKTRDVRTGVITGVSMSDADIAKLCQGEPEVWIVDDICDGGATFLNLADYILVRANELNLVTPVLNLFVTHGIFSKGKEELRKRFRTVLAYNDWTRK